MAAPSLSRRRDTQEIMMKNMMLVEAIVAGTWALGCALAVGVRYLWKHDRETDADRHARKPSVILFGRAIDR